MDEALTGTIGDLEDRVFAPAHVARNLAAPGGITAGRTCLSQ